MIKWSTAGLNSKFSFSLTGCLTKLKNLVSLSIYPKLKEGINEFMIFLNVIIEIKRKEPHPGFELW